MYAIRMISVNWCKFKLYRFVGNHLFEVKNRASGKNVYTEYLWLNAWISKQVDVQDWLTEKNYI